MCGEGGRRQQDGGDVEQDQERLLSPRGLRDGRGSGAGGLQQRPEPAPGRAWEGSKETVKIFSSRQSSSFHLRMSGPGNTGTSGREYELSLGRLVAEHKEIIGKLSSNITKPVSPARQVSGAEQSTVTLTDTSKQWPDCQCVMREKK